MAWGRTKHAGAPEQVRSVGVAQGDKLIAAKVDELTGSWVLACRTRIAVVTEAGEVQASRPWLDVDRGGWDPDRDILQVSWIEGGTPTQWKFTGSGAHIFTDAFRDRVQASVVLTREVDLGPRRTARVAIRKDLETGQLIDQVIPGDGAREDDAELAQEVAEVRATLRDQSGLTPQSP